MKKRIEGNAEKGMAGDSGTRIFFGKRSGKNEDSENNSVEKEVFEEEFSEKQHTDKYKDHREFWISVLAQAFSPMILAEAGYHVTAIDYTPGMLEKGCRKMQRNLSEKRAGILNLKRMDAQALSLKMRALT